MTLSSHPHIYDSIGEGYRNQRVPDPRIAARIRAAIGPAQTVCNLGAGAGSYEPVDCEVTAVEPSETMIAQRASSSKVVCCAAESLPFSDGEFDAAMAVLTVHHWTDPIAGLAEMRRVSTRQVIFTFDPELVDALWLVRDYLPEVVAFDKQRSLSLDEIANALNSARVETVEVPFDCTDGFQGAFWRRPERYLDAKVRASISTFAQLPAHLVNRAINKLAADLRSGDWKRRYADLLERDSLDVGYRLVIGDNRSAS